MRLLQDMPLRYRLIIAYSLFTAVLVSVVGLFMYDTAATRLKQNEVEAVIRSLDNTCRSLDSLLETNLQKCDYVFSSTLIQEALQKDYTNAPLTELLATYQNVIYQAVMPLNQETPEQFSLTNSFSQRPPRIRIYPYNQSLPRDGDIIWDNNFLEQHDLDSQQQNDTFPYYWRGYYKRNVESAFYAVSREMYNFKTLKSIGVVTVEIPAVNLRRILQLPPNDPMQLILVDADGHALSVPGTADDAILRALPDYAGFDSQAAPIDIEIDGQRFFSMSNRSGVNGWLLLGVYPYSQIDRNLAPVRNALIKFILLGVLAAILLSAFIAHANTRRLRLITHKMAALKQDRNAALPAIPGNDEIGNLDALLSETIAQINTHIKQERLMEDNENKLKLELLQANINPHILCNTLSAIKWRIHGTGADDAEQAVEKLMWFYRFYLNSGLMVTTLSQEAELTRNYVDIIVFTYDLDIDYTIDIQPELTDINVSHLMLQPLVENALIHGLHDIGRRGKLTIAAMKKNDVFLVTVADNGAGIPREKMADLLAGGESGHGYGLCNVQARVKLYYGPAATMHVESEDGKGTTVTLTLPLPAGR